MIHTKLNEQQFIERAGTISKLIDNLFYATNSLRFFDGIKYSEYAELDMALEKLCDAQDLLDVIRDGRIADNNNSNIVMVR